MAPQYGYAGTRFLPVNTAYIPSPVNMSDSANYKAMQGMQAGVDPISQRGLGGMIKTYAIPEGVKNQTWGATFLPDNNFAQKDMEYRAAVGPLLEAIQSGRPAPPGSGAAMARFFDNPANQDVVDNPKFPGTDREMLQITPRGVVNNLPETAGVKPMGNTPEEMLSSALSQGLGGPSGSMKGRWKFTGRVPGDVMQGAMQPAMQQIAGQNMNMQQLPYLKALADMEEDKRKRIAADNAMAGKLSPVQILQLASSNPEMFGELADSAMEKIRTANATESPVTPQPGGITQAAQAVSRAEKNPLLEQLKIGQETTPSAIGGIVMDRARSFSEPELDILSNYLNERKVLDPSAFESRWYRQGTPTLTLDALMQGQAGERGKAIQEALRNRQMQRHEDSATGMLQSAFGGW